MTRSYGVTRVVLLSSALVFAEGYAGHSWARPADAVIAEVDQRVSEFHAAFNNRTHRLHQERVRSFWLEWLSPEGFFRNLAEHWKALSLEPLEATSGSALLCGLKGSPAP